MDDKRIATKNLVPGKKVYDEKLIRTNEGELRIWDPFRSKLAGAIRKGMKNFPFKKDSSVLYLGASTGTTISHLSDITTEGDIYAVEFSPTLFKSLFALCELRENIVPIHADARKPDEYSDVGKVDVIYQDVAQPDQADILIKNAKMFLKKNGIAMITIKSQSIDVTKKPTDVFEQVLKELEQCFEVLEQYKLEPFDKEHLFVVLEYSN